MEIDTIIWALEKLKPISLHRTPQDLTALGEPWFSQFQNMPTDQFKQAIDEIIKNEKTWPSISTVYKYASAWEKSMKGRGKRKDLCPYCEDTGFILIRSKGIDTAYACKCERGRKAWKNFGIASHESLGIPWPEFIEKPSLSKKMSKENKRLIDTFLGRISKKMPKEELPKKDLLWGIMVNGSLETT